MFDDDNNDVTPVPLYQSEPAAVRSKVTRFFLDEISVGSASYHTSVAGSLSTPFSRCQRSHHHFWIHVSHCSLSQ